MSSVRMNELILAVNALLAALPHNPEARAVYQAAAALVANPPKPPRRKRSKPPVFKPAPVYKTEQIKHPGGRAYREKQRAEIEAFRYDTWG